MLCVQIILLVISAESLLIYTSFNIQSHSTFMNPRGISQPFADLSTCEMIECAKIKRPDELMICPFEDLLDLITY